MLLQHSDFLLLLLFPSFLSFLLFFFSQSLSFLSHSSTFTQIPVTRSFLQVISSLSKEFTRERRKKVQTRRKSSKEGISVSGLRRAFLFRVQRERKRRREWMRKNSERREKKIGREPFDKYLKVFKATIS